MIDRLMMTIAVPVWDGRVSPVLDVANRLLVVEQNTGTAAAQHEIGITSRQPAQRVAQIAGQHVNVLICGALSWPLEQLLVAAGIEVIPHICGFVEDVLRAYERGELLHDTFLMPGCRGPAWRRRGGRGRGGGGRRGRIR